MRKLLLFTFTVALLSLLSVNTFAQWGKTVEVANDEELSVAMTDDLVETMLLAPGNYALLPIEAGQDSKVIKAQAGDRATCLYFIQTQSVCIGLPIPIVAFTNFADECPTIGVWSLESSPLGSTVVIASPPDEITTASADLPGRYVFRYTWDNGNYVEGDYYVIEKPLLEVTEVDDTCEDECFEFVVTLTRDINLPPQSQALPPYDLTYEINGGGVIAFQILLADLIAPGVYQKTLEFCDYECGDYQFVFTYLQANNNNCGGDEVIRNVEVYDIPYLYVQDDDEICGLVYDLEASYEVECDYPAVAAWSFVSGPGTADFDGSEVTVSVCGDYTFLYTVTNGPCEAATTVNINFYDEPMIDLQDDDEVCGLEYDLDVTWSVDCAYPQLYYGWSQLSGPGVSEFDGNSVTVDLCGSYTFEFFVNNGPCYAASQVTIDFYDTPQIYAGEDDDVCGLEYTLMPWSEYSCEHPDYMEGWSQVSGPGTAVFTGNDVVVDLCGDYTFLFTVTNGPCGPVTDLVAISFYDEPVVDAGPDQEVCGVSTELEASWTADCAHPDSYGVWTVKTPGPCAVVFDDENDPETMVTVGCCGEYELLWTVYNNDCEPVSDPVWIKFYDTPEVYAGPNDEICGLVYELMPEVDLDCEHPDYTAEWSLVDGPGTAGFVGDVVTVSDCGEYEFLYTVTNGPCEPVTSTVTINFYDIPVVDAGEDDEVCGLTYPLMGSASVICEHPDFATGWFLESGPGTATFVNGSVTVSLCGVYTFGYWASNGEDCYAVDYVTIGFFDEPVVVAYAAEEVCGFETNVTICTTVDCEDPNGFVGTWTVMLLGEDVTDEVSIISLSAVQDCEEFAITVTECGEYDFTYTVGNGPCEGSTSFTIIFYEEPDPEIIVPDVLNLCAESTFTVQENSTCYLTDDITYVWGINPPGAGNFIGGNTGTSVTIEWNYLGPVTVYVTAYIGNLTNCTGYDEVTVDIVAPTFAGQVKYWNQFETFMPSPYPTIDYSTYPHDYFYVELWNGEVYIDVTKVEPTIKEVEVGEFEWVTTEFMSYFEFDLTEYVGEFGCDGYWLKIWDGGLYYHYAFPGGSGVPPVSGTHLGANYTYNNWGGVNATDALAVQMMATAIDINGVPYNFNWVGPVADSPRYGYYSHSAADVNSSNPYVNGGITALDALTTNYRAVGLIDVFPNSQPGVQYSPNFRVTGRLVPDLTYTQTNPDFSVTNVVTTTWPMPFDYDNADDVPFTYPTTTQSYLYFTDALLHKYTSAPITLSDKNFIHIYYLALGDANSSYVPTSGGFKAESEMALVYNGEQIVSKGQIVEVPIRIDQNAEVGAISLDLSYNTSLIEVIGVNYDEDFFMVDAETGTIRVMWYNLDQPANFAFGDAIATIQVRVLGDIKANTRFFELEANTELADRNAQPIKNISLETTALSTVSDALFMTNYPNPFRTTTTISYNLPEDGNVSLVVYNKLGQVVETLVSARQEAGTHTVDFGRADLTAGVYFCKIIVEGEATHTATNSMIIMQ
ncbi:MAG: T9SS type A sorting domain-containing protein [Bacteroidales bacterium]|nr:T9SS type A sorting domain-containing protein [Bacteroidales bacterium]